MTQFVALHNQHHQQLRIDPERIEALGAHQHMVPVVLSEFLKLVVHYPIVFSKNSETGQFVCSALLGFTAGENLFWQNNQWQGIYTPLQIMRQPFFIGEQQGQTIICIDMESNVLTTGKGEAIFDSSGQETDYLQQAKTRLAALINGENETQVFIKTLLALNLIMPMALDISFANQQQQRIQGLYTINEETLAQLGSEQLMQLQQQGYLKPIYTMIASLGQIYALIQKKMHNLDWRDMHNQWQVQVQYLGQEKNPLLVIDQFATAPEQLIAEACNAPGFSAQASDFYPGLRKPVDPIYAQQSLALVAPLVKQHFLIAEPSRAELSLCAFSLTTTPADKLRPIQAVPHIDTPDPLQFAMVHYLCEEQFGGTSFYRHRSSGYETITEPRMADYFKTVKQELMAQNRREFDYINGDTELFQRIGQVPVKFNRCIVYRSNLLHSGDINPTLGLSANPREGRLTINSFFRFR